MTIEEKLTAIAANTPRVYEAGKAEGIAEGRKSAYDEFWDTFQGNGDRYLYWGAFAGSGWDDVTFKPKYPFVCVTTHNYMFYLCKITYIPTLHINVAAITQMFYEAALVKTIEKLVFEKATTSFSDTFTRCNALENLTIEGVIGGNGFNVQWSTKLSKASITSIINALSTITTGLTVTLSKTAVNNAFATAEGAANGSTSAEWLALVATRSNWTIALA
jgi:hypothetical protein